MESTDFTSALSEQDSLGQQIHVSLNSFVKANQERRRKMEFIKPIHDFVLSAFAKFNENNDLLTENPDKSSTYYKENYHLQVQTLYNKTFPKVLDIMQQLYDESNQPSAAQITKLKSLIKKQRGQFKIIRNNADRVLAQEFQHAEEIDYWVNSLHTKLDDISSLHSEIGSVLDEESSEFPLGYTNDLYFILEDEISSTIQTLIQKKSSLRHEASMNSSSTGHHHSGNRVHDINIKLDVPEFDGTLAKWPKFRDLFENMVHKNEKYSDSYKFYILTVRLVGKAANLISCMNTDSSNYNDVWKRILQKFDNKKLLIFDAYDRLFNQKPIREESATAIRELHDNSNECIGILKSYKIEFTTCESAIVYLLINKLDAKNRELYEQSLPDSKAVPTLDDFFKFLDKRSETLQCINKLKSTTNTKAQTSSSKTISTNVSAVAKCVACSNDHWLYQCEKFKSMDIQQRWKFVNTNKICGVCLRGDHQKKACKWKRGCPVRNCNKKHNILFHANGKGEKDNQSKEESSDNTPSNMETGNILISNVTNQDLSSSQRSCDEDKFIFLGTAQVYVEDKDNNKILCRAMLDSGSQANIITCKLARKLGLSISHKKTKIMGIGSRFVNNASRINFNLSSRDSRYSTDVEANILPKITSYSPSENLNIYQYDGFNLADPNFSKPGDIDLLLGNEIVSEIENGSLIKFDDGYPSLKKTQLGHVVIGKYIRQPSQSENLFCGITLKEEFENYAPRLWDMEDLSTKNELKTIEEELAEEIFVTTTTRNTEGKFVVTLPKVNNPILGESFQNALRNLKSLEKRLSKKPLVYEEYSEVFQEYLRLGHMEETTFEKIPKLHNFLPHHAVMKESTTTTLRVVFNGSYKTSNNVSLNDILLNGPILQNDVFDILLNFRSFRYAMSADIEKMYRQVFVAEPDQFLQLVIWRNSPSEKIKIYKIRTVTFGITSSPYLATRCLLELALQNQEQFPKASELIRNSFYVDDLLTGSDDLEEAKLIQYELISSLKSGGFNLRKWCSNESSLLINTTEDDTSTHVNFKTINENIKTLGIVWHYALDTLSISTSENSDKTMFSKRIISAESGQIFDPLGIVSPCIVIAKLTIQKLWKLKIDWDSEIPEEIQKSWLLYRSQVHLELVSDLTTSAFLACLKRFICRRGKPLQIYSDNATNFVGAREELKKLAKFLKENESEISSFTVNKGIDWSNIPARSPHFGGLWESSVKRAKFHIKDLVIQAKLTFEEMYTVIF